MESMSPILLLAYNIRRNIKSGRSITYAIGEYIESNNSEIAKKLCIILECRNKSQSYKDKLRFDSFYSESLFHIIWCGLQGKSIQKNLESFIIYYEKQCLIEIEAFLAKLPFKLLVPLLLLQFPAFLILLFGPILETFQEVL